MRDFKNMKRQRGRNRGGGQGGGGRPQQNANRAFESNGPDNVKIRGHAQHVFEKYQQLARDAFSSGDRVLAENYLQHADHYFRLLRTIQPNRSPSEILGRDTMASGLDIDFEEELEPQAEEAAGDTGEAAEGQGGFEPRQDSRPDNRQDGGGRYDRDNRQDRYESRDGGWRDRQDRDRQDRDRPQDNRSDNRVGFDRGERNDRTYGERQDRNRGYGDRQPDGERAGRFEGQRTDRYEGQRNDRYEGRRDNRRFDNRDNRRDDNRQDDNRREPRLDQRPEGFAEGPQPSAFDTTESISAAPAETTVERSDAGPVLRSQDGGMSEAPAFLQPASAEGEEPRPRVRRRRAPRSFQPGDEAGEGSAPTPSDEA